MMMVVLNSRILIKTQDESNESSNPGASRRLHAGILVTREQWTVPPDIYQGTAQGLKANSDDVLVIEARK